MPDDLTIARFVLEAQAPLMIAGGEDDPLYDNALARDANGLPMLPATGIAGMLRAGLPEEDANAWFGYQDRNIGQRSTVTVTDGLFHWSDDQPRDGLLLGADRNAMLSDDLCKAVLPAAPVLRDHVRLNPRGVVDGEGKFNRVSVPSGARFTFELRGPNETAIRRLMALVHAGFWLGGATRSGYGAMACIASGIETILMKTPEGQTRFRALAATDIGSSPLAMTAPGAAAAGGRVWRISGQIEGPLLIGGPPRPGHRENRAPYREAFIAWTDGPGSLGTRHVLPGSAVKGPLRHRTLYHLQARGLNDNEARSAIDSLFGHASSTGGGLAGKLRFADIVLPETPVQTQTHVGLDRFTGGARSGSKVLFTDTMLWRPRLDICVTELKSPTPNEAAAFECALVDVARGLCGIGAEWGEGAGIFERGTQVTTAEGKTYAL
jgi:hypothetical protein